MDVLSKPTGPKKHKHYVSGASIKNMVSGQLELRSRYLRLNELLFILYGREPRLNKTKDSLINAVVEHRAGTFSNVTFSADRNCSLSRQVALVSRENAIKILEAYVLGGYDNNKFISILELERLLPEIFNQKSASKNHVKDICGNKQVTFYMSSASQGKFIKAKGYLAEIAKLKNYFLSEYERMNFDVEREIVDSLKEDYKEIGITISSKSFSIKQKPSEYLFLRAGMRGGQYNSHLPQILGYHAIRYFFVGNDRQEGAFARYDIEADDSITEGWQSHKGRHWQTTSLFRAGLSEMVINKWMGRTTGQGEHYDHNTGRERAKLVGDAMLEDTNRFLGGVPDQIKIWKDQEIPEEDISVQLQESLKTVQYSPLGFCTRDLYLKPCEFNLRCLAGSNGMGCKHYIYDLHDSSHREKVTAERDKSSLELTRLFELYENGIEAAEMHIQHHMMIVRNTTAILENAEIILHERQLDGLQDFMPFKKFGSFPDDCPFQCGGN